MEPPGPLPAWKREILERKRAKLAGAEPERAPAGERLVLGESLGPLRDNPFMRLEGERRRLRQGLPGGGRRDGERPLQELLDLYSAVPGIRTIRADNVLIIESQPGAACFAPAAAPGPPPAEIRAARVWVYEPPAPAAIPATAPPGTVSRLLQKFDQRPRGRRRRSGEGEPGAPGAVPNGPLSPPARPGPLSISLPARTGPTAISLPAQLDPVPVSPVSPPARPDLSSISPHGPAPVSLVSPPARPDLSSISPHGPAPVSPVSPPARPDPSPISPQGPAPVSPVGPPSRPGSIPGSPVRPRVDGFLRKISSNSFTVTPRGPRPGSCAPLTNGPLEHGASPDGRSPRVKMPPVPSPSASVDRANTRGPKPQRRDEIQLPLSSATPGPLQTLSASAPKNGVSFDIRPAPKPDLAAIPAQDLQAQALANLRLNSRNSFLVVPRRGEAQGLKEPAVARSPLKPECEQKGESVTAPQAPQELLVPVTFIDEDIVDLDAGNLLQEMAPAGGLEESKQPQEATSALGMEASAVPASRPHSALQQRVGNTFTIVPKRKPPNSVLEGYNGVSGAQQQEEEGAEESRIKDKTSGSPGEPQMDCGTQLKKRYPTVHEIEVIGGYLSLERSCMSKTDSRRKKMKISFNETSLQTMFEYPSESSLVEEEEEEGEESVSEGEEDDDDKPYFLCIPRPTSILTPSVPTSGFSSYTPKHSVDFSKWQDQEFLEKPLLKEASPPGSQVMLTPADQTGLSDFSSEPALYF